MTRTTLSLPDDLARVLKREARRRHVSVSAVAREALEERFGLVRGKPRDVPFAALGRSADGVASAEADQALAGIFEARHAERLDANRDR